MTTIRRWAVGMAAAVTLVVAIWAVVSAPGTRPVSASRPPVTTLPVAGHTVALDNRSDGSSVDARLGSRVVVDLSGPSAVRWSAIVASPYVGVLARRSGELSRGGTSSAVFLATGIGRVTLTSTGAPICASGSACPQFLVLWRVSVVVTAS